MNEKNIRWGMIGTGNVTEKKSAPSFNKIKGSQLVAVANRTPKKAQDYAARHGIAHWHEQSMDVIHDPEVDIVYIATAPGSHMEYALECIRAGKPVYIEKPMARTWEECNIINRAAAEKGVSVYVAFYRRGLEYFRKVKEIIDGGSLGQIININLQQYFAVRDEDRDPHNLPWRVIPEDAGGGYFHDVGCHALDILFYMFGDPLEVQGTVSNLGGLYVPEDTLSTSIRLPGELLLTGNWSFLTPKPYTKDLVEIVGEKGVLKFSIFSFQPITLMQDGREESIAISPPEHIQMPLITSIVDELNGKGKCPSTGLTAAVTSRAMDQITGRAAYKK